MTLEKHQNRINNLIIKLEAESLITFNDASDIKRTIKYLKDGIKPEERFISSASILYSAIYDLPTLLNDYSC